MTDERKVIDEVKRRNPPDTELRISRTIPGFLEGQLFVVEILRNGENVGENYYYDHDYSSSKSRSFTTMDELALWLGRNYHLFEILRN